MSDYAISLKNVSFSYERKIVLNGIVKKRAVREYPKSVMDRYQAAW